jgi:N-acylneuraminate cytidylyltransferase
MKTSHRKILGLVTARSGSKGIPGKNIVSLAGRPLIQYTIDAAKASHSIDSVVVSTDDTGIAGIAKQLGTVVVMRPKALATDTSPVVDAVVHALDTLKMKGYSPEIIILLQPTSPLRSGEDIDRALDIFTGSDAESVISVCEAEHSPYWDFVIKNDILHPVFEENASGKRRQDLPKVFRPNGAIYIITPKTLRRYNGFITEKCRPYIMPRERSVDIDTSFDLFIAECLLNRSNGTFD